MPGNPPPVRVDAWPDNHSVPASNYELNHNDRAVASTVGAACDLDTGAAATATRSAPWMAIAFAAHFLLLVMAAFIVFAVNQIDQPPVFAASLEKLDSVIPPDPKERTVTEVPKDQEVIEEVISEPTETEALTKSEAETPSEKPLKNSAETPAESPNQNPNPNSALGFAGGGGGGGGGDNGSGEDGSRPPVFPPREPVYPDRTAAALQWLADHQAPGGYWSATDYHRHSLRLEKWGNANSGGSVNLTRNIDFVDESVPAANRIARDADLGWYGTDVGLTGLALLAFTTAGYTHVENSGYRRTVNIGVRYLISKQNIDGFFGEALNEGSAYGHAICTMLFAELYALTDDPRLKPIAQRAVSYIERAQNEGEGWRYEANSGDSDTSVTAWMVLALKSAKLSGLKCNYERMFEGSNRWLDMAVADDGTGYPTTGYRYPGVGPARTANAEQYKLHPSMDACNLMIRCFTGQRSRHTAHFAAVISRMKPMWYDRGDEALGPWQVDMYHWYYASLALYQFGGSLWHNWQNALFAPVLLPTQRGFHKKDVAAFGVEIASPKDNFLIGRKRLDEHGSWDPVGAWGQAGGRVYSTAINALTLAVFYRYHRVEEGR